jgi:hypothetical protein
MNPLISLYSETITTSMILSLAMVSLTSSLTYLYAVLIYVSLDSDGEEAGADDEGFDFDLVPNGDVKMEE